METVDDYLATVPDDARAALARLRKTIKAAAPEATEVISYRIPAYKHHGLLVGFAAATNHCTFHVMSTAMMRAHAAELKEYEVGKGSIRFPAEKPLPTALVTRLVKARIAENERRGRNRRAARHASGLVAGELQRGDSSRRRTRSSNSYPPNAMRATEEHAKG